MGIRTRVTALAVAATLAALTGCTSSTQGHRDNADTKPAAAKKTGPPKLSTKWRPKLDKLDGPGAVGSCNAPGSARCADDLTTIMEVAYDLQDAIDTADAATAYPETGEQVQKMATASDGYVDAGCKGDPNASADDSPCHRHALAMAMGPAMLDNTLTIDEAEQKQKR